MGVWRRPIHGSTGGHRVAFSTDDGLQVISDPHLPLGPSLLLTDPLGNLAFLAVLVLALDSAVFYHGGGFLSLANMTPKLLGLIERHPAG